LVDTAAPRTPNVVLATLAAVALLLGAAGCTVDQSAPPQRATPVVGTSDINPQPREKLRKGGTLKLSIQQWIEQYNIGHVDGTQGDGAAILGLTQPALWFTDENGVPRANPDVLASAEVTATAPAQVVTYQLNPKATWSDRTPVTWRDFEIQWRTRNGTSSAFTISDPTGYDLISKVERGADDRTAVVTFSKPYADWQSLFDPLLPGTALDTPDEFNSGWLEKIPVWGGPWKIGTADKTTQTITVVPNPDYWGTKPVLDSIVFRALDSTAITEAFLNKEIDQAPARQPEAYRRLAGSADTVLRTGSRWDETLLSLASHGPLTELPVRQALGKALNRQAIADSQSGGLPFKVNVLGSHFYMPGQAGYQDSSASYGTFDLAGARTLLTQAGWAEAGAGQPRTKNGTPLKLTYVVSSGSTSDVPQLVQNMLGQVGFQVELQRVPANDFFAKYVNTGSYDLVNFRSVDLLFPSQGVSTYRSDGTQNFGKIGTPEIDRLLEAAAAETDRSKSTILYNQADALIWQVGHSFPLFQTPQISAVRTGLANFGAFGLLSSKQYVDVGWLA